MGSRWRWTLDPRYGLPALAWLAVGLLLAAAGCGGGLELIPVTGTVTLDDQPLADAAVVFTPVGGGPAASATTDAQGRFQLTTVDRPGAVPGVHLVTVTKQTMLGVTEGDMPGPGGVRVQWHVPEKYSNPETSGLRANVSANEKEFAFRLLSM